MPTSEEELQAQRDRNDELRQAIAEERAKTAETQASLQNEITSAELDAEGARLAAQLAEAQAENERLANIKPKPLADAEAAMEAEIARMKAQEESAAAQAKAAEDAEAAQAKAEKEAEEQAEAQRAAEEAAAQRAAAEAAAAAEAEKNGKGGN